LVNLLDGPLEALHRRTMGHLSAEKLQEMVGLLEEVRAGS
jgi:hypothetical protein